MAPFKNTRRDFLTLSTSAALTVITNQISASSNSLSVFPGTNNSVQEPQKKKHNICAFIKFVQELSFDKLAETIASQGYQGIEATIRPKGMIEPENVKEQLPRLVAALKKHDIEISVMTTKINSADSPINQTVLKTAADLGIKRYRTDYYRYDLKKPVLPQIDFFRSSADKLAKMNRQLGISGVYQNHAGARYLGSTMWDLQSLLRDIDPNEIGIAFDIRHAIASAGQSWPVFWSIAEPHVRAIYFKDFVWDGLKTKNVPLGDGVIDPKFYKIARGKMNDVPISLHVEYLQKDGLAKNIDALQTDLNKLHNSLGL